MKLECHCRQEPKIEKIDVETLSNARAVPEKYHIEMMN